jgi:hypothetical protein
VESDRSKFLGQIDQALDQYRRLRAKSSYDDCSDQPNNEITAVITSLVSAIHRAAPPDSSYRTGADKEIGNSGPTNCYLVEVLPGILTALREAIVAGHIEIPSSAADPARDVTNPPNDHSLNTLEQVSMRWLIDNVPWGLWAKFFSLIGALIVVVFAAGVYMGQFAWARELLKILTGR